MDTLFFLQSSPTPYWISAPCPIFLGDGTTQDPELTYFKCQVKNVEETGAENFAWDVKNPFMRTI